MMMTMLALAQRRAGRTTGVGSAAAAAFSSVPLLLLVVLLLAATGNGGAPLLAVAAFSPPQPSRGAVTVFVPSCRGSSAAAASSVSARTRLAAAASSDRREEEEKKDGSAKDNGLVNTSPFSVGVGSSLRTATVASALFLSVLMGDGAITSNMARAADAPAKPASTTTTTTTTPIEASLHIPKLRRQIKSLQKTLLEKEAVARQDRRVVTKDLENQKRVKVELQRAQDEEQRVKIALEKNEKKKKEAAAAPATSTTSTSSRKSQPKKKPDTLSRAQIKSLDSRQKFATKRITAAKKALTEVDAALKISQSALDKSSKDAAKVQKELKEARRQMKEAQRVRGRGGYGGEGRYVFGALAPIALGGGVLGWLVSNPDRDGYSTNYDGDYDRDGYYDEYGYSGDSGRRMSRRRSQRKQFQTALVLLATIGLTSSIASFNAEGDGVAGTFGPIVLGVGVLSWVVVWQQRQRDEYLGINRYDEYGNRIVGGSGNGWYGNDLVDPTATQAAIILFSALGLTAALLSYGSYGNDASDLLGGSTFVVLGAVGVGLWAYNNKDYIDEVNEYDYGRRRYDRGLPLDFDAAFSRRYDEDGGGRAPWWEWWKNDPDRFRNGLNRRTLYDEDRRGVDVIRNDDYYANYDLDRRFSGPPPPQATNGYNGRDVEPRSGGRAGPLARRGERYYNDGPPPRSYPRQEGGREEYFDDGRYYDQNYRGPQDRRYQEYSDQPSAGGAPRSPPPGAGSRSSAGGEGSQNRDSNRWGNSLSQWD